ncbi:hypothetical protein [Chitinimonas sp.]|uniref:WD40/YVTN/BNR-like repeat-containing protein n=1 Tax=Chitinimonas sp. TaxID=1934313 RepID=UPI002F9421A2
MYPVDILTSTSYKEYFLGYELVDCTVRDKNIVNFVLKQSYNTEKSAPADYERETRVIILFLDDPDNPFGYQELSGWSRMIAGSSSHPKNQFIGVDSKGEVYVLGSGEDELESKIPGGGGKGPSRGAVTRLKQVDGWLYGCDNDRSLFKREAKNQWVNVGGYPKASTDKEALEGKNGFEDFDMFSETDIYAAGGKGDVWHYAGTSWKQIAFPSNMYLHTVCCGQDGYVYIGAQSGHVFRGRDGKWEHIHKDELSLPFKDMVWFGDRVYATSDYGLWEIKDGKVAGSDAPIEITNCAGNLAIADGVMLLAGHYGAALHDGKQWTRLFSLADLSVQK